MNGFLGVFALLGSVGVLVGFIYSVVALHTADMKKFRMSAVYLVVSVLWSVLFYALEIKDNNLAMVVGAIAAIVAGLGLIVFLPLGETNTSAEEPISVEKPKGHFRLSDDGEIQQFDDRSRIVNHPKLDDTTAPRRRR